MKKMITRFFLEEGPLKFMLGCLVRELMRAEAKAKVGAE